MNKRHKLVIVLGASALAAASGLMMSLSPAAQPADVNMAEVRQLARESVETIFAGAPIGRISDADYWKTVRGSAKPVVVIFYANQGQQSRHLATVVRYLAREFSPTVEFYGYPVTGGTVQTGNIIYKVNRAHGLHPTVCWQRRACQCHGRRPLRWMNESAL